MNPKLRATIDQLNAHIRASVDPAFLEKAPAILERLKRAGKIESLHDLKDVLLILRNLYVPAAMAQEVAKLAQLDIPNPVAETRSPPSPGSDPTQKEPPPVTLEAGDFPEK